MLLAAALFGEPPLGGWYLGLAIGFTLVVVVVIIVGAILALATQIGSQARAAIAALEAARANTQPLEELARTNETLQSILRGAQTARAVLEGK